MKKRIDLGICEASGAIHGVRLAEVLSGSPGVERPLIVSRGAAATTIGYETDRSVNDVP